ncbi:hypothetical protein IP84_08260 [beta proteobacterium AAP99]|nr:hypothetical protein IP84_08260 [beta proteobacterium AAP99]
MAIGNQGSVAVDLNSLNALRDQAGRDPKSATRAAAVQFETMFNQMLLKSMRESLPKSDLMGSSAEDTYRGMLDGQMATAMAGRPGGLADMIEKALARQMGAATEGTSVGSIRPPQAQALRGAVAGSPADPSSRLNPTQASGSDARDNFIARLAPEAQRAAQAAGIPADFMLAQAGLESGWGRREIVGADGRNSFNLFGIKATPNWKGATVDVMTTEYVGGKPVKRVETFRAYNNYAEAFADYGRLISQNQRYDQAMRNTHSAEKFAASIQQAGYATDPNYGRKLLATIQSTRRSIGGLTNTAV